MKYFTGFVIIVLVFFNADAQSVFRDFDVYGTSTLSITDIERALTSELAVFKEAYEKNDRQKYDSMRGVITKALYKMGNFAFVNISLIRYFSEGKPVYVTFDIVDESDRAKRLNFLPNPHKSLQDPDSLLHYWNRYDSIGMALMQQGKLTSSERCKAFHCLFGFDHPDLKPFQLLFEKKVEINKSNLLAILREDRDPNKRAYAAYLLAHIRDGNELVRMLKPSIRDSSYVVRNNVMRVISDIGYNHPDIAVPFDIIKDAIDFPTTTDRNKALAILFSLSRNEKYRSEIKHELGDTLLALLKLKQPNNHLPAFNILKELSGENYSEFDYDGWQAVVMKWRN